MTSYATDRQTTHECGGTILVGASGEQAHHYCDHCGAYRYDSCDGDMPTGTDSRANRAAWDEGKECSPDSDAPCVALTPPPGAVE